MSNVFEAVLSSPEALLAFGDKSFVQAMLRFEAGLARAQASCGLIPAASAQSIIGTCKVELFDAAKIVRESPGAGGLAISLVKSLKETVGLFNPDAVAHVHFGATSQDAIDTAMALMTRDVLHWIELDVRQSVDALLTLAARHADTPMLARTLMQPSSITSFGFKCVAWGAPLVRGLKRLRAAAPGALALQLGAAVGLPASMNGQGARVSELMAQDLGLTLAPMPWHTQRDEWVAMGCELGLLTGSLGKIAKDIVVLSQFKVGEVVEVVEVGSSVRSVHGGALEEPAALAQSGRGASPALPGYAPQRHEPLASGVAIAAALRAPQCVAALLATIPQAHERAAGAWQAELAEGAQLVLSAHGAARAMAQALSGLQVHPQRMRANLDAVVASVPKAVAAEWFRADLLRHAAQVTGLQSEVLRDSLS